MNLAKGVINTCVEAGIKPAAGWMVSLPHCQSSDQISVSSTPWVLHAQLYLATSKFKPGDCHSETRQISHGGWSGNSGRRVAVVHGSPRSP